MIIVHFLVDFLRNIDYYTTMIYRHITPVILESLADSPVVLINGARQTGKSTISQWLGTESHPARYLTFDDATVLAAAQADPSGFLAGIKENVILDEIQRIPELFTAIKVAVDRNRSPGRFLLTGSANILLLPHLSESLAGRMEIITLWPFSQCEIEGTRDNFIDHAFDDNHLSLFVDKKDKTTLISKICYGGYPEILKRAKATRRSAWFQSYMTTILQRDVRDIANIQGLTDMPKLLSLLAARTASLLNFAELSRSSGLTQTTLKRYMTLLQATYMITLVPAWSGNLGKRLVKAPKCFLTDTGLTAHLMGISENRIQDDPHIMGPLLEQFTVLEVHKQSTWSTTRPRVFHFRSQAGHEVDIILEDQRGRIIGIEVKASQSLSRKDFTGLQTLKTILKQQFHRGIILYTGTESIAFGKNLHALPIQTLWQTQ